MSKFINFKSVFSMLTVVMVLGIFAITTNYVNAKPQGLRQSCLGKKIDSFNVILKPNQWDDNGNGCNGSRIFFFDDGSMNFGQLHWILDPDAQSFREITDCDGTDGDATVKVDEYPQNFVIAIRLLGPNDSSLELTCHVDADPTQTGNEDLCIIDDVKQFIQRGTAFTKISGNIAEDELEGITYSLDGDWKIFQVWIVEWDGSACL